MSQARLLITGIKSGSGKTTVTCGLLCALKERGFNIKAFKCGPDYIDPMFHKKALGVLSGNLDSFFCDEKTLKYLLMRNEAERDIAVIEGAMGYYDGAGGGFAGSSYDVAWLTQTPVILVADCKGMSNTAAAVIKGIADYRKDSNILGGILNRISATHVENAK